MWAANCDQKQVCPGSGAAQKCWQCPRTGSSNKLLEFISKLYFIFSYKLYLYITLFCKSSFFFKFYCYKMLILNKCAQILKENSSQHLSTATKQNFLYGVAPTIMHGTEEPAHCRPHLFFSYTLLLCLEKTGTPWSPSQPSCGMGVGLALSQLGAALSSQDSEKKAQWAQKFQVCHGKKRTDTWPTFKGLDFPGDLRGDWQNCFNQEKNTDLAVWVWWWHLKETQGRVCAKRDVPGLTPSSQFPEELFSTYKSLFESLHTSLDIPNFSLQNKV